MPSKIENADISVYHRGTFDSCDTFVAMRDVTSGGSVIFGKNSDRPRGEVQEVIAFPASKHEKGKQLKCTYISIPQVETTSGVVLSKPSWMWGAEMGSNQHGVAIGNEAVWNRLSDPEYDAVPRLLGMDLLRLGLERGSTALEALEVITKLLEEHGQGGQCSDLVPGHLYHNAFLIADHQEAWILETAKTLWVAQKIKSGVRNISNCMSIGSEIDLMSEGLKTKCLEEGWWDPKEEFNWKKVMEVESSKTGSSGDTKASFPMKLSFAESRYVSGLQMLKEKSEKGSFTVEKMMEILRDKRSKICRPYYLQDAQTPCSLNPTTGSQISVLSSSPMKNVHWFTATPDPTMSVYKPFFFGPEGHGTTSQLSQSQAFFPKGVKEPHERSHPLWSHQEKLAFEGALTEEVSLKMTCLENELMNQAQEVLSQRKQTGNEEIGKFLFHQASEQEMAL